MPQPSNNIKYTQWQSCDQCGRLFPMSSLVKQKGLLICTSTCFDNLEVERRPWAIMQVMNPGAAQDQEGADLRTIDRGFFEGVDQEVQF
jgi:hypothetical protein